MDKLRFTLGTCIALMLLAAMGGYGVAISLNKSASNEDYKQQYLQAEQRYQIQLKAKEALAEHVKALEKQHIEMAQKLSLFEGLTQNDVRIPGIKIKAVQLFSTDKPQHFRYRIVLAKDHTDAVSVQGVVQMVLIGKLADQLVHMPVNYGQSLQGERFEFRYVQELKGEISLPAGLDPHEIIFTVTRDQSPEIEKYRYPWQIVA